MSPRGLTRARGPGDSFPLRSRAPASPRWRSALNEAAFVIRLCYAPDREDEWTYRSEMFRSLVLPRLRAQTVPADIWVWTHPRHTDEAKAWGVETFTVAEREDDEPIAIKKWKEVRGLPRYPVQLLMGSDDLVGPDFVKTVLDELSRIPEPHAIVTFQPLKLHLYTRLAYEMAPYHSEYLSPFVALRQPVDDPRYNWVWALGHTALFHLVDAVRVVPAGHCLLTVHGRNDTTSLLTTDRHTEVPPWL